MRSAVTIYSNPLQRESIPNCPFATDLNTPGACLDYAANRGFYNTKGESIRFEQPLIPKLSGPFVHNQAIPTVHVRDGLSNTIAIGDRWIGPKDPDNAGLAGASSATIMRGPIGEVNGSRITTQVVFPVGRMDPSIDKFGGPSGHPIVLSCFSTATSSGSTTGWIPMCFARSARLPAKKWFRPNCRELRK